jgi:hypothetical protein
MASLLPETPGRGRSRFSKALPSAPRKDSPKRRTKPTDTPLPALPKNAMPAPITIPRRPVGGGDGQKVGRPKASSVSTTISSVSTTISSGYSESLGLSDASDARSDTRSDSSSDERESLSGIDSEESGSPPPPLPQNDIQRRNLARSPKTPPQTHVLAQSSSGYSCAPTVTELWKRRSHKSDRSIKFPDLKLDRSNGSTAVSPPKQQEQSNRPIPFKLPRSNSGFRKHIPARPAPPQPPTHSALMGAKVTKLKEKHSRGKLDGIGTEDVGNISRQSNGIPQAQDENVSPIRLPTPKYNSGERGRLVETVRSPHTPTEASTPELPKRSDSRPKTDETTSRSSTQESSSRPSTHENGLLPSLSVTSSSDPVADYLTSTPSHSRDPSETLTITTTPITKSSPVTHSPNSTSTSTVRLPTPQKITFPTYPRAAHLSTKSANSLSPSFSPSFSPTSGIAIGPPLSNVQLDCYQSHRFMRNTRNKFCPVACMICARQDSEQRWRCSWCCLSACGSCMSLLAKVPDKDLRVVLDKIGRKGVRS